MILFVILALSIGVKYNGSPKLVRQSLAHP